MSVSNTDTGAMATQSLMTGSAAVIDLRRAQDPKPVRGTVASGGNQTDIQRTLACMYTQGTKNMVHTN